MRRIVEEYYTFFERITNYEQPPIKVVYFNRRFIAFLLLYCSANNNRLPNFIKKINLFLLRVLFSIESSSHLIVEGPIFFPHPRNIIIGASSIGQNVVIYHNVTIGAKRIDYIFDRNERPKIGANCVICTGAVIIGGGELSKNCIVYANELKKLEKFNENCS